jgi:hypothetical protein
MSCVFVAVHPSLSICLFAVCLQGQQPAPLQCDKECEQQSRRHQIADAFGVDNAEQHAAYWDRHRTPTYSPALLQVRCCACGELGFYLMIYDTELRRVVPVVPPPGPSSSRLAGNMLHAALALPCKTLTVSYSVQSGPHARPVA